MALSSRRIVFIRHGETAFNAEGRLQGQLDIALNPKGREQAAAVGRSLRKLMPAEMARLEADGGFVASPLQRTRQTMELMRPALGLDPDVYGLSDALVELSFGEWEGLTWPEIAARHPEAVRERDIDKWRFAPPRGESYAMLADRMRPWLEARKRDALVVSHGGVARAFIHLLAGVDPARAVEVNIWQGRAIVFENGGYRWVG